MSAWTVTATAFDGATQVAVQHFTDIAPNTSSGLAPADLLATNITSVTISIDNPAGGWDFLIDSVAFNQNVQTAVPNSTPAPAAMAVFAAGALARRRRRE